MSSEIKISPVKGVNTRQDDVSVAARSDQDPRMFVRDALNLDITESGRIQLRGVPHKVTQHTYQNLWRSSLHGDLFGTLDTQWVRIDAKDWTHEVLANLGGSWASHCLVNDLVCVTGADGIFVFDGRRATPLPMQTPGKPFVSANTNGSLPTGDYGVAVSCLRGTIESSVSERTVVRVDGASGGLVIGLPIVIDSTVSLIRVYITKPGSSQLQRVGDFSVDAGSIAIDALPQLGAVPEFEYLDAMPTGRFAQHWRGRLITASARTLHFSEPMAPHLYDRRHGFVSFPQRITFVAALDGGVWVGQVDHVLFLDGPRPQEFNVQRRAARAPVVGSAIMLQAEHLGEMAGGAPAAVWLAENGYVVGNSEGQMFELHRSSLDGITAANGSTTVWGDRLLTVLR